MNIKLLFQEGSTLYVNGKFEASSKKIQEAFSAFFNGYFDTIFQCQVPGKEQSFENMQKLQTFQSLCLQLAFKNKEAITKEEIEKQIKEMKLFEEKNLKRE